MRRADGVRGGEGNNQESAAFTVFLSIPFHSLAKCVLPRKPRASRLHRLGCGGGELNSKWRMQASYQQKILS